MIEQQNTQKSSPRRPLRDRLSLAITALAFTAVGIYIATQFDLPARLSAGDNASRSSTSSGPASGQSPFVGVIAQYTDAIVEVSAERTDMKNNNSFFGGTPEPTKSAGSGFFFRPDGYVLTNNHVVGNAVSAKLRTGAGFTYEAKVVGRDEATDLAVLKVDTKDKIVWLPFGDSDSTMVGEWAIAIGNPFPQQGLARSATVGIISAKGRSQLPLGEEGPDYQDFLQTDAAINPGNSGGPLININGECIGINSAISSPTGASAGIAFAIPINLAKAIVPDLIAFGEVQRGWLGVYPLDITPADAKRLNLDEVRGVVVERVINGSPAASAGLRKEDIIYEYNGHKVNDRAQFQILVSTTRKDSRVPMSIIRGQERLNVVATLADRKTADLVASRQNDAGEMAVFNWLGMELVTYDRLMAERIGTEFTPGVLVNRVLSRSAARSAGFAPGDVITEIGGMKVRGIDDFQKAIEASPLKVRTFSLIVVDRNGNTEYRSVRP